MAVGPARSVRRRHQVLRRHWAEAVGRRATRASTSSCVEASLRRLRTDHIDLYQLHIRDPTRRSTRRLRALDDLVRAGKVRYVGCSNFLAYQLARGDRSQPRCSASRGSTRVQPRYNLLFREIERELFPLCAEQGIARHPVQPARRRVPHRQAPAEAHPTEGTRFTLGDAAGRYQERYWHDRMFDTVEALRPSPTRPA